MDKVISVTRRHKLLTIILLAGFLASISYAFYFQVRVAVDAKAYDSIAWSLVQGTGYTETTNPVPDNAIGRLGPGYEFFLAFWYFLFGHRIWIIWIVQSLMHVGSGFLLYLIIKKLLDDPRKELFASLGAGFYIFFIDLLEFPAMLLTETLYLFFVLLGLYFSVDLWKKQTYKQTALVAFCFTLAILVRPPATMLMLLTILFLLYRRTYKNILVLAAVVIVMMTPWTVRNYLKYHRFIPTTYILGYDVWVGNSPGSKHIGELNATNEIDNFTEKEGLFAVNERGISEVKKLVLEHPFTFLKLQITKTSIYFSAARPAAFWFHLTGIAQLFTIIFSSLFAFVIFSVGLAGLWRIIKKNDIVSRMLLFFALAAPAGIVWIVAETRYRYQFYPMLIIFGVLFLAEFLKNNPIRERSPQGDRSHSLSARAFSDGTRVLVVTTILISANTLFDFLHNSARVVERLQKLF